jgi:hypothetical protein
LSQVTSSDRRYDFNFAEDMPSESYQLADDVERTSQTDAAARLYFDARLSLHRAIQPSRMLPDARLSYSGTESVAEVTSEYVQLYPTSTP